MLTSEEVVKIKCGVCGEEHDEMPNPPLCVGCGENLGLEETLAAPGPEPEQPQHLPPPLPTLHAPVAQSSPLSSEQEIVDAFAKGHHIVSVIGFADSGKTFFVNRLRHDLPGLLGWVAREEPEETIALSPHGIELTHLYRDRQGIKSAATSPYLIVDLAGESFLRVLKGGRFQNLAERGARDYLATIALSSAYILVISVEDLFPIGDRSQAEKKYVSSMISNFYTIISSIAIATQRLEIERQTPEEFLDRGITSDDISSAFASKRKRRCGRPITVVFSQADKLERDPGHDAGPDYDKDPVLFALRRIRRLFNPIHATFDHYRFDFLSAFSGHPGGLDPDYTNPSYGAAETLFWIHRLIEKPSRLLDRPRRLASGQLPTRIATGLRRRFDRDFRAAWSELSGGQG